MIVVVGVSMFLVVILAVSATAATLIESHITFAEITRRTLAVISNEIGVPESQSCLKVEGVL